MQQERLKDKNSRDEMTRNNEKKRQQRKRSDRCKNQNRLEGLEKRIHHDMSTHEKFHTLPPHYEQDLTINDKSDTATPEVGDRKTTRVTRKP